MRRGVLGVRICSLARQDVPACASDFSPSVAAIQKHLGAVEKELEKIGRIAGRQTTDAVATQISDAISTILSEMVDRFRGRNGLRNSAIFVCRHRLDQSPRHIGTSRRCCASRQNQCPLSPRKRTSPRRNPHWCRGIGYRSASPKSLRPARV
jgi:hypothetical protein